MNGYRYHTFEEPEGWGTGKTRLMIAVCFWGILAGFAPYYSFKWTNMYSVSHEFYMYPNDIAFQNEVYLILRISGSTLKYGGSTIW